MQAFHPRCFLVALLTASFLAIYLPSLIVAAAGLSPLAAGRNLASATVAVADEALPAMFGFATWLTLLLYARRRWTALPAAPADILGGCVAMAAMAALQPGPWSRAFGIGVGGRFDPALLAVYLLGAALAGLAFHLVEKRCRRVQAQDHPPKA